MALKEWKQFQQCASEKCKKIFSVLMQAQWGAGREAERKDVKFCPFCGQGELKPWAAAPDPAGGG